MQALENDPAVIATVNAVQATQEWLSAIERSQTVTNRLLLKSQEAVDESVGKLRAAVHGRCPSLHASARTVR